MKSVIITVLLAISALAQAPKPGTIVGNSGGGGGGGTGTVTSIIIAGTTNQITATGTCTITTTGTCTLSLPSGLVLPGTVNGLTITTTTGTITIASAKVLTVSNSLTLAGTDGVTLTFPTTSATIARTDAGQTFTGNQTMTALLQAGSTAPTQTQADNSTKVATTAYVDTGLATKGTGTVTTVGFTGGIISVANPTTAPAFTVAGTSGGLPYFSGAATWASSAVGTINHVIGWGGVGNAPVDLGALPTVTGGTCTNQAVTAISGSAVPTCTTITGAYVNGSIGVTASPLSQFASTTSAQLLGVLSDATGTGAAVFGTSPTVVTPSITTSEMLTRNGIGAVSSDGYVLQNTTAAANGAQQWSPRLHLIGQGWKTTATAASQTVEWVADIRPIQAGASPDNVLVFTPIVNGVTKTAIAMCANGAGNTALLLDGQLSCNGGSGYSGLASSGANNVFNWITNAFDRGNFNNNGFLMTNTSGLMFASGASSSSITGDVTIDRDTAGLVGVQSGAPGTTLANYRDLKKRFDVDTISTAIASASTIAPTTRLTHITGTTTITTITVPTNLSATNTGGCIVLIPDGLWATATGGNIALASTAVVNRALTLCYDTGTTSWYPSYL